MRVLDFRKRVVVLMQEKLDEVGEDEGSFSDLWEHVKDHIDGRVEAEDERADRIDEERGSDHGDSDDDDDLGEPLD